MKIAYALEPDLSVAAFIDVLRRSTLAERRPVEDTPRIAAMLKNADVICTARTDAGTLVGVARAVTDFSYCCYLSDLAVDQSHQGQGIGKALMRRTHEAAGEGTTFILISAPGALSYYPHVGLDPVETCFRHQGPWPKDAT